MTGFDHFESQLDKLDREGRLRELVPVIVDGPTLVLDDGRRLINFGGNDYLGLANRHVPTVGSGSGASPLLCGWTDAHRQLAETIASFESAESAALFPSGFAACSGTVSTLAQDEDLILSDELNHASLIDGCRLSRAKRVLFRHRDVADLEASLKRHRSEFRNVWIVTDGVFSMDGHVAPLDRLCDVAERHGAHVVVDEAHGTGVLGETGSGACEALGVKDRVSVRIGTLSKAIGSQGGFVAGPKVVIDYLINRCRTLIYSTALSPAAVAAAQESIQSIRSNPEPRHRVHELAGLLRRELGLSSDAIHDCVPIVPLIVGSDRRAVEVSRNLRDDGFYVPAIRPPTVLEGSARLRISLSASHDEQMVEDLVGALRRQKLVPGSAQESRA